MLENEQKSLAQLLWEGERLVIDMEYHARAAKRWVWVTGVVCVIAVAIIVTTMLIGLGWPWIIGLNAVSWSLIASQVRLDLAHNRTGPTRKRRRKS